MADPRELSPSLRKALSQRGLKGRIAVVQPPSSEINQAALTLGEKLPEAIQIFLTDPFLQIPNPNQHPNPANVEAITALSLAATALPSHAPQLTEGLKILQEALGPDGEEPLFSMPRRFTAFLITDMLLYQTALPIGRRPSVRFSKNKPQALANIREVHASIPEDRQTLEIRGSLAQVMQAFQEELTRILVHEPQTRDEAYFQALLYNAINKIMTDSTLYREFAFYGDSEMHLWIATKEAQALAFLSISPFSFDLLQAGVFEELDPHSLGLIFAGQWELLTTAGPDKNPDEEKLKILADYFLSHPRLQYEFWESEAIDNDYSIIAWFFKQNTETLNRFIETMQLLTTANKLINIRNVIIAYTGYLKHDFPDHPNVSYLLGRVHSLAKQFNLTPYIQTELAILEDREPGVLYESAEKGLLAHRAKPGETREELLARMREVIIYVSQAPWPQRPPEAQLAQAIREAVRPAAALTISPGEENATTIISDWLDQQLARLGINRNQVAGLADHYQTEIARAAGGHLPFLIIPEALPRNHPLRKLAEIGVVTIQPSNGQAQVVIDTDKAHIQAGFKRISLTKTLNQDLTTLSLFDLLLLTAGQLAKRPVGRVQLDRAEQGEVNGFLKDWKRRAADMNLPRLTTDAPEDQPSQPVMFLVGDKPTTLYVAS